MITGDCLEVMPTLEANSIDSIVTDPPYGLGFMGKDWDHGVPGRAFWEEALRVAKPGAHLLAFGGPRTFHRLAVAIEEAGWEIRDVVSWNYGSGFPKGLNISKGIDRAMGAEREVLGYRDTLVGNGGTGNHFLSEKSRQRIVSITAPATPAAAKWDGWNTVLKPAWEPIIMARKPLEGGTVENVLKWETGGINVGACRIGGEIVRTSGRSDDKHSKSNSLGSSWSGIVNKSPREGRYPANMIHDSSPEILDSLKGAARFFYSTKASKQDRNEGLDEFPEVPAAAMEGNLVNGQRLAGNGSPIMTPIRANNHPTVKPTSLMSWLCRLVTPPGGLILDPFAGSGSTGKAAMKEGFRFLGIEKESEYSEIARARIAHAAAEVRQLSIV